MYRYLILLHVCFSFLLYGVVIPVKAESTNEENNSSFIKTFYLINVDDAIKISVLFRTLEGKYFRRLGNFSLEKGIMHGQLKYFDFDENDLLKSARELLIIEYKNLPKYRKERKKITYNYEQKQYDFEVKNYKQKVEVEDKHPLISQIKRKERVLLAQFLSRFTEKEPLLLKEAISIGFNDIVYEISHYGMAYGFVSMRQFTIGDLGMSKSFILIKLEIDHHNAIPLTLSESNSIVSVFKELNSDIQRILPPTSHKNKFGYIEYSEIANTLLPTRSLFRENELIFRLTQALFLIVMGWFFIVLVFGKKDGSLKRNYFNDRR